MQSITTSNEAEPSPSPSPSPSACSSLSKNNGEDDDKMLNIIAELSKGQASANELLRLVHQAADDHGDDGSPAPQALETIAKTIEASFSTCISLAISITTAPTTVAIGDHHHRTTPKVEDSGESSRPPTTTTKGRRGCYKRRRSNCESWIKDSPNQLADEYAWRKYGQKAILDATHPRSYYRCTHKNDQGCPATKQVQQISDDPALYRTTYTGYHTCSAQDHVIKPSSPPPIPFDARDSGPDKHKSAESSIFINFESNMAPKEQGTLKDDPFCLEFLQTDLDEQYSSPTASDYLTTPESTTLPQEPSLGQLVMRLSSPARGSGSASASGSGSWSGSSDYGDAITMVYRPMCAGVNSHQSCVDDMDQIIAGLIVNHDQLDEIDWLKDEDCAAW